MHARPYVTLATDSVVKQTTLYTRAVESEPESEGILGGVGVGKKCADSDSDLSLKS
jgi:hypothetical protein